MTDVLGTMSIRHCGVDTVITIGHPMGVDRLYCPICGEVAWEPTTHDTLARDRLREAEALISWLQEMTSSNSPGLPSLVVDEMGRRIAVYQGRCASAYPRDLALGEAPGS